MNVRSFLLTLFFLIISLPIKSEVTLDGTLGPSGALSGPDYQINAELGQQKGGNLFHSFQYFNLSSHESATFSGDNSVHNVISRVTGGNPSKLDGLLRSTIQNADLYFLNPNGIMFGPNARLDVQGSFHASTADSLRLEEGGRFDAREPSKSVLTVAPVSAFGFLTDDPASISTENSNLSVPEGKTFSLIGGDLRLKGQSSLQFDPEGFAAIFAEAKLATSSGRINLASLSSKGEIIPDDSGLKLKGEGGKINIENTLIEVSGKGSGAVFIRGDQFIMDNATIQANTLGNIKGKNIDIRITDTVKISSHLMSILNQSLSNKTLGSAKGGEIIIVTPRLELIGSFLITDSFNAGQGGNINIEAVEVFLKEGAIIQATTHGPASSGDLYLKAKEILSLSGIGKNKVTREEGAVDFPSTLTSFTLNSGEAGDVKIETGDLKLVGGLIGADSFAQGNAGDIEIQASNIELTGGAIISTTTHASGKGGNLNINVVNKLSIGGQRDGPLILFGGIRFNNNQSGISTTVFGNKQAGQVSISASSIEITDSGGISASTFSEGIAGSILINVDNLLLSKGAIISSSNSGLYLGDNLFIGHGKGGRLEITATGDIVIEGRDEIHGIPSGINSDTFADGAGGNIKVQANHLLLKNGGIISAHSRGGKGNAGDIFVSANTIHLTDKSAITVEAENARGGNLTIVTPNLLYLEGGEITTSVGAGKGRGGDLSISQPSFVVLDKGKIKAQADEGSGGNIRIMSDQFIASPDSLVSASSKLGLDGSVNIDSPDMNFEQFLVVLPGGFIEEAQLPPSCNIADVNELSTFEVRTQHEGMLRMPRDFME
jgi:filamentous hemagglutinin family protein